MYARIERFNLAQGFAELAEDLADRIAPIMRRQPGLQSITLLSDETSGEYILLTRWDTHEQIGVYEKSADEWRVRDIMSRHITTVPSIEVYQVHALAAAGGAGAGVAAATPASEPAPLADASASGAAVAPVSAQRALAAGVTVFEPRDGQCPADFPVKGNHSRSGDFIYHLPGSRFYDRTDAEVCFATEAEAQAAGFRAPRA